MILTPNRFNKDTKDLCKRVSITSGISEDIVKEVWQQTLVDWLIQISEKFNKKDNTPATISIPFLGNLLLRYEKTVLDSKGDIDCDLTCLVSLNKSFKDLLISLKEEKTEALTSVFKDQFLDVIEDILQDSSSNCM